MDFFNVLSLLGGLALFLYGMNAMGDGLAKLSGGKMEKILEKLTTTKAKGVLLGAGVTTVIQSSSATTVMVVGFVNSGSMKLRQAVGIIFGANIGTTITAWILSLSGIQSDNFFIRLLKPSSFSPVLAVIGVAFLLFSKKDKKKNIGSILVSFAVLMFGMEAMSGAVEGLKNVPEFTHLFTMFSNPLLGILVGAVLTGIIQSSSASVGILQALCVTGAINFSSAIPLILGQNIGTCVTALISSIGASKNAKRAAVINLLFNTFGVIIWGTLIFIIFKIFPGLEGYIMSAVSIAIFHSGFKVVNTTLFYPIAGKLVDLSKLIIRDKEETQAPSVEVEKDTTMLLDDRILNTPSLAIQAVSNYVIKLGKICSENLKRSLDAIMYNKYELIDAVFETEKHIDDHVANLSDFLVKISNDGLTDRQSRQVKDLMYTVIDLERVGDHAENLAELAGKLRDGNMKFSEVGVDDLKLMRAAVESSIDSAVAARETGNIDMVRKTFRYEDEVDSLEEEIRDKHIERLSKRECNSETGVIFLNILTNLERVSDHAINIAGYVKDEA